MTKVYIVILGDLGNSHYQKMITNMKELGNFKKILDNVFVLKVDNDDNYEEIRNKISGSDKGYCIVISTEYLKAAWNLQQADSAYLQSFFN